MALTLRLSAAEEQQLEALKESLGASTSSAALKSMIQGWASAQKELKRYRRLYQDSDTKLHELEAAVTAKLNADRQLTELLEK